MKGVIGVRGANNGIGYHLSRAPLEEGHCVAGLLIGDGNLVRFQAIHPERMPAMRCDISEAERVKEAVALVGKKAPALSMSVAGLLAINSVIRLLACIRAQGYVPGAFSGVLGLGTKQHRSVISPWQGR